MAWHPVPSVSIHKEHSFLMESIMCCDNMMDPQDDDIEFQQELTESMNSMQQRLSIVEEVLSLKSKVDCDCFYR